jgi:hypothetical protein
MEDGRQGRKKGGKKEGWKEGRMETSGIGGIIKEGRGSVA